MKEIKICKNDESEKFSTCKAFLFMNGEGSMIIYANSLLDTATWLEKNGHIKNNAFSSGTVLFQLNNIHNQSTEPKLCFSPLFWNKIENYIRVSIQEKSFAYTPYIRKKYKKLKHVDLYKKTESEEFFLRKVFLFINDQESMVLYVDCLSDAASWLEKNHYMKSDSLSNGTLLFQLEDDPLWWYFTGEEVHHEQQGIGSGLGNGVVPPLWELSADNLKKIIQVVIELIG